VRKVNDMTKRKGEKKIRIIIMRPLRRSESLSSREGFPGCDAGGLRTPLGLLLVDLCGGQWTRPSHPRPEWQTLAGEGRGRSGGTSGFRDLTSAFSRVIQPSAREWRRCQEEGGVRRGGRHRLRRRALRG